MSTVPDAKADGLHDSRSKVEDLRAAVEWLQQQGRTTTGISGHSKAGSVVIMYAAKYGDVPQVANISGRFTLNEGITARFGQATMERVKTEGRVRQKVPETGVEFWLTQESVDERIAIGDMHRFCKAVPKTVSVLDIHGEIDKTINMMDAIRYADATPGAKLHVVPGGNHTFSDLGARRELLSYVVPFLCGKELPSKDSPA
ncbi:hypothetical protein WJX84_009741 [Apatococcus fuscideae]|uniref:Peptidase S9 prolyl oligopeptidase catalytic domain-containing protein n=1 Tax=Apatococcus fuscideae TaxID=2026836 RepID=A0AAW1RXS6_9CHLO